MWPLAGTPAGRGKDSRRTKKTDCGRGEGFYDNKNACDERGRVFGQTKKGLRPGTWDREGDAEGRAGGGELDWGIFVRCVTFGFFCHLGVSLTGPYAK